MESMRVLLADDHPLFRDGMASLLTAWGMEVVGQAGDGLEAFTKAQELQPDLILMDVRMPRCNGLEATRRIKAEMPQVRVVMLTVSDDDQDLFEAIKNGAEGYLLKNLQSDEFSELLAGISKGVAPMSPELATRLLEEFARQGQQELEQPALESELTEREKEVLQLLTEGASNKEIATSLYITENTVKYHLKNILQKLHLQNRVQAATYAVRKGLLNDQPLKV